MLETCLFSSYCLIKIFPTFNKKLQGATKGKKKMSEEKKQAEDPNMTELLELSDKEFNIL